MINVIKETLRLETFGMRVPPGETVLCTNRPQYTPFMWKRFEINDPESWMILNVAIGNCSLFKQNPGEGSGISAQKLNDENLLDKYACQVGQDFSIAAMYVGPDPEGAEFICDIVRSRPES